MSISQWPSRASALWMLSLAAISCGGGDEVPERGATKNESPVKMDGSRLSACFASSECNDGLACYGANTDSENGTAGFCIERCSPGTGMDMGAETGTDMEMQPSNAPASCPDIQGQQASCSPQGMCRIDCTGGGQGDGDCPKGMDCRDVDASEERVAFRCVNPIGTGAATKKVWEECNPAHGDADCSAESMCVPFGNGRNRRGYCAARCEQVQQCLPAPGATAAVVCATQLGACSLNCAAPGSTCPKGMECVNTGTETVSTPRCRYVPAMSEDTEQ